jgi:hypothetical protein
VTWLSADPPRPKQIREPHVVLDPAARVMAAAKIIVYRVENRENMSSNDLPV